MPVDPNSPLIKEIGRKLKASLSKEEIGILATTCEPQDILAWAAQGTIKHVQVAAPHNGLPATFDAREAAEYLVTLQDRIIAFDAARLYVFHFAAMTAMGVVPRVSRGRSGIVGLMSGTDNFVFITTGDLDAVKIADHIRAKEGPLEFGRTSELFQDGAELTRELLEDLHVDYKFPKDVIAEILSTPTSNGLKKNPRAATRRAVLDT